MPMYNLIENIAIYSKRFESLYQICRDEPKGIIAKSE